MGYQESLVVVRPHQYLHSLVLSCEQQRKNGFYEHNPCTVELRSVIVLKRRMHQYPAGTKFLWVSGDRCFHNTEGLLEKSPYSNFKFKLDFIPVESFFRYEQTEGIDFETDKQSSENGWFRRFSPDNYLKQRETERGDR